MKNVIIWGAALLFVIWLFWFAFPVSFQINHSVAIAVVASIVTCIISVMFVSTLMNYFQKDKEASNADGILFFAVILISAFGTGAGLIYHHIDLETKVFAEDGIFTTGIVIDGKIMRSRKADFSSLTISYTTIEGKEMMQQVDISSSMIERYGINQEVPIVYSKADPSVVKILYSDADISRYSSVQQREIKIADLIEILNFKTAEEAQKTLNAINQKWEHQQGSEANSVIYENKLKNSMIKTSGETELTYVLEGQYLIDEAELKAMDLVKMDLESITGNTYTNGTYILNIKNERTNRTGTLQDIRSSNLVTVISLVKK